MYNITECKNFVPESSMSLPCIRLYARNLDEDQTLTNTDNVECYYSIL